MIDLVHSQSRRVAYDLVEPLSRFLSIARELCDGDLDQVVLMIALTLRSSLHPDFRALEEAELEALGVLPGFGTNMRSLADSTGIPRETARRKLALLIERGWITWHRGALHYTASGYRSVEPARVAMIRMNVRGFQVVDALQARVSSDNRARRAPRVSGPASA
ncbi:MAG: hypothetical protein ABW042_09360 [Phenylobacterium sp.]